MFSAVEQNTVTRGLGTWPSASDISAPLRFVDGARSRRERGCATAGARGCGAPAGGAGRRPGRAPITPSWGRGAGPGYLFVVGVVLHLRVFRFGPYPPQCVDKRGFRECGDFLEGEFGQVDQR
ncbi:hypothetical protein GCM10020256_04770 [Streptomyces thermocoprophilus]